MSIKKGRVYSNPLLWNRVNPPLTSLISHKLSINPHKVQFLNLEINVQIKLSYIGGVDEYYWRLIREIEELRGRDWEYKEIADYLNSQGYKSRRGKSFYGSLVERIYKKYLIKMEKEMIKSIEIKEK